MIVWPTSKIDFQPRNPPRMGSAAINSVRCALPLAKLEIRSNPDSLGYLKINQV